MWSYGACVVSRLDELFEGLPRHLTVDQLADVLGVGKQTAYNWLNRGVVPGYKLGNTWLILRDEVRDHLASQRAQRASAPTDEVDGPTAG